MPKESANKYKLSAVPDLSEDADGASSEGTETETCPLCYGSGLEVVPGKGARTCECRRRDTQSQPAEKARLPRRYASCHFHNYKPSNPSQEFAYGYASRLTMEYPAVERGLLYDGNGRRRQNASCRLDT